MRTRLIGGALLVLALGLAQTPAQGQKGGAKGAEVAGTLKEVDAAKSFFVVELKEGKDRKFAVTRTTKFLGPQGGASKKGMKDDRMAKGAEVVVTPSDDGKEALEVKFGYRKKKAAEK